MALSGPEALSEAHDLSRFACGQPSLNHWLKVRALPNQRQGFTTVVVVHDDLRVVGYYGLAATAVQPSEMPRAVRTGQPPTPVPCLLLGQLATDVAYAGQGVGIGLVTHAYRRCIAAAQLVGARALVVHAVDDAAAAFWRRRGFLPSRDDEHLLFRTIASLQAAIATVNG